MSIKSTKKTAILVIHGVGPYKRFQAIQFFTSGFLDEYQKGKTGITKHHLIKKRDGRVQNCISISSKSMDEQIDCYEYFWDIHMVHKVLLNEGWDLLVKASKNAKKYYENELKGSNKDIARYTDVADSSLFRKKRSSENKGDLEFKPDGYLNLVGGITIWIVKIIPYIPWIVSLLEFLSKQDIPIFTPCFKFVSTGFKKLVSMFQNQIVKVFLGDVVRYLDMDPRSKNYETRQKIINGAVVELRALMDDNYDQIVIAGHSLGSVIAYDAINRIILQISALEEPDYSIMKQKANKVVGLVTFGSPLDKIGFFFREYIEGKYQIQREMTEHTYTFRTKSLFGENKQIELPDNFYNFPQIKWLNFYHKKDLISGKLDLYDLSAVQLKSVEEKDKKADGNICIEEVAGEKEIKFTQAHGCYWGENHEGGGTPQMHKTIIKEFLS